MDKNSPNRERIANMVDAIPDDNLQLNGIITEISKRLRSPLLGVKIPDDQSIDDRVLPSLRKSVENSSLDDEVLEQIILEWQKKGIPRDEKIPSTHNSLLAAVTLDIAQEFHMNGRSYNDPGGSF